MANLVLDTLTGAPNFGRLPSVMGKTSANTSPRAINTGSTVPPMLKLGPANENDASRSHEREHLTTFGYGVLGIAAVGVLLIVVGLVASLSDSRNPIGSFLPLGFVVLLGSTLLAASPRAFKR